LSFQVHSENALSGYAGINHIMMIHLIQYYRNIHHGIGKRTDNIGDAKSKKIMMEQKHVDEPTYTTSNYKIISK
jgi:hypothetical protein